MTHNNAVIGMLSANLPSADQCKYTQPSAVLNVPSDTEGAYCRLM